MVHLIYKYLVLNNQVIIPGIGVFSFCRQAAGANSNNTAFNGPSTSITFTTEITDRGSAFFTFISNEQKIEEAEAIQRVNEFVRDVEENLAENKKVQLPGLGFLFKNEKDELLFKPAEQIPGFFPDVQVEKEVLPVTKVPAALEKVTPVLPARKTAPSPAKSPWGKYILILAIIAVIAVASLVYYFIRNLE